MKLDPFRSDEERFFYSLSSTLPQLVSHLEELEVVSVVYEPFSMSLPSGEYTPDFLIWLAGLPGHLTVLIEVKGSKKQKGYKETRIRLREAVRLYPMFVFIEVLVNVRTRSFASFEIVSGVPFPYSFHLPK